MNSNELLMILLLVLMSVTLLWEMHLKSATRTRRKARRAAIVTRTLAEIETRESAELRARIRGGADVLALLDRSKIEMPGSEVSL